MAPRAVLLDLLMATMDSIATWTEAAGDRARGLAWRDAVTSRMIGAGRYVDYNGLVERAAAELGLAPDAPAGLREAWARMRPWPDAIALVDLAVPYAFVTNCSSTLAALAADRSGLQPAFTLTAEDAGWFKPRREVYALAIQRLGVEANQVQFVAGAAYDAVGGSNAGLSTILIARRVLREPLPRDIKVVESLHEAVRGLEREPA